MSEGVFKTVVSATGLPEEMVEKELEALLVTAGRSPENMTLDDLREIMADLLQDVLVEMKAKIESGEIVDEMLAELPIE